MGYKAEGSGADVAGGNRKESREGFKPEENGYGFHRGDGKISTMYSRCDLMSTLPLTEVRGIVPKEGCLSLVDGIKRIRKTNKFRSFSYEFKRISHDSARKYVK